MNVDPTVIDELTEELLSYCSGFHLEISRDVAKRCIEHFFMVVEVNRTMNLTRITDEHSGLILHILDSLLLLPYVNDAPEGVLLDIGTGAGYPGIPLLLATNRAGVLLDSVAKKVKAVDTFLVKLDIPCVVTSHERVEVYARDHRASCACVVARAVAPLSVLLEYAAPLLCLDGRLVVTKGVPSPEELSAGLHAAKLCGFEFEDSLHIELPDNLGERTILTFVKKREAKLGLPRKVGVAKKQPLGY